MLPKLILLLVTWTPLLALAVAPAGQSLSLRQQGWKATCSTVGLGQWPWPGQLSSLSASSPANSPSLSLTQTPPAGSRLVKMLLHHSQHTPLTLSKQDNSLKLGVRLPIQAHTYCLAHRLRLSQAIHTCCTACKAVPSRLSLQCSKAGPLQRSMCPPPRLLWLTSLVDC